ncbi:type 1 glutamine amidotransferase domain-containing protein [Sphingobacterium hungaricum]|uniref:Protease n=1 Tax=Sphingobacterium hungaricum TaxID=2082723 RepID=A0A928UWP0_9SPHI|nr:type 1 glutamine amidotransferase domain-containing protein [Sphingobacterium hungaricum]MBE8712881.1 protease [Sphingobacterium hungaricum]
MSLHGKKVAILTEEGFEEVELTKPQKAIEDAGGETFIISPESGKIKSWDFTDWGKAYEVDVKLDEAKASDYDALLLPGGVINPDKLRLNKAALDFIKAFVESSKPVAAICHAPWSLVEAKVVSGKKMTSYTSIKTDVENAGATWVDEPVVVDGNLITSRNPDDLEIFSKTLVEAIEKGS